MASAGEAVERAGGAVVADAPGCRGRSGADSRCPVGRAPRPGRRRAWARRPVAVGASWRARWRARNWMVLPRPMSSASTPPRPSVGHLAQPGGAIVAGRAGGRRRGQPARRQSARSLDGAEPFAEQRQRALDLGGDLLAVDHQLAAEGRGQGLAGGDLAALLEPGELGRVGPDPAATKADHAALGLDQQRQLVLAELLAADRCVPPQLAHGVEAQAAGRSEPTESDATTGLRSTACRTPAGQRTSMPDPASSVATGPSRSSTSSPVELEFGRAGLVEQPSDGRPRPGASPQREQHRVLDVGAEALGHARRGADQRSTASSTRLRSAMLPDLEHRPERERVGQV